MALSIQKKLLLPLFFLSGFSALVYEVLWTRLLSLTFGSTIEAISAVVTAFMAGMAFGSYFAGKLCNNKNSTLLQYAVTELGIGVSSLLLYFLLMALPDIHSYFHDIVSISFDSPLFHEKGYITEFILIFIPATLIGATFPLMVKLYITSRNYLGEGISIIYTLNTLGAVFGAFLTGFFLIKTLGVRNTLFIAVTINIILAAASLLIKRFNLLLIEDKPIPPDTFISNPVNTQKSPSIRSATILAVLTISGFTSLAYQIAWTRLLTLVIGNSVYAFSIILTTFLAGISIGSFLLIKHIDRIKDRIYLLGILQLLLSISVLIIMPIGDFLPVIFIYLYRLFPTGFIDIVIIQFLVSFSIILIPTVLIGISFPLAARIYTKNIEGIGEGMGRLYSFNTVGALFGSFISGFYLIPGLGTQSTIILMAGLNLLSSIFLALQADYRKKSYRMIIPATSIPVFILLISINHTWNSNLLNRGVYIYAEILKKIPEFGGNLSDFSKEFKLLYYKEGREGTVAVSRSSDRVISMQINGKTDASTSVADMQTQIMISALPLLLHPNPDNVALIGLGSGISLGTAEIFPVKHIDCIEIIPEVVSANRYFSRFNHHSLDDQRINLVVGDARHYLSSSKQKYDVIINEPSNPWIAGSSNLFTLEFFKIAKARLNQDGIMCQWFNLYTIDTRELKILLNTFRTVFPHTTLWAFSQEDLIILGSGTPIKLDDNLLDSAFDNPEIKRELIRADILDKNQIQGAYLAGNKEIEILRKGADINTDNRPIIEFEAPKTFYRPTANKNIISILSSSDIINRKKHMP